jgi:hypothetical protein
MSTKPPPTRITDHAASILRFLQADHAESLDVNGKPSIQTAGWEQIIDQQLAKWIVAPEQLADNEYDPPTPDVLRRGLQLAQTLRELGAPSPSRLVSTGDGGISFEFRDHSEFSTVEITPEGPIELVRLVDSRVVLREQVIAELQ